MSPTLFRPSPARTGRLRASYAPPKHAAPNDTSLAPNPARPGAVELTDGQSQLARRDDCDAATLAWLNRALQDARSSPDGGIEGISLRWQYVAEATSLPIAPLRERARLSYLAQQAELRYAASLQRAAALQRQASRLRDLLWEVLREDVARVAMTVEADWAGTEPPYMAVTLDDLTFRAQPDSERGLHWNSHPHQEGTRCGCALPDKSEPLLQVGLPCQQCGHRCWLPVADLPSLGQLLSEWQDPARNTCSTCLELAAQDADPFLHE